jgi:hypothetical protein
VTAAPAEKPPHKMTAAEFATWRAEAWQAALPPHEPPASSVLPTYADMIQRAEDQAGA